VARWYARYGKLLIEVVKGRRRLSLGKSKDDARASSAQMWARGKRSLALISTADPVPKLRAQPQRTNARVNRSYSLHSPPLTTTCFAREFSDWTTRNEV
jgi:hypothetical protein